MFAIAPAGAAVITILVELGAAATARTLVGEGAAGGGGWPIARPNPTSTVSLRTEKNVHADTVLRGS